MKDEINKYMEKCKAYENDVENFSLYIHGFLLIWLRQQREAGKLTKGMSNHSLFKYLYSQG